MFTRHVRKNIFRDEEKNIYKKSSFLLEFPSRVFQNTRAAVLRLNCANGSEKYKRLEELKELQIIIENRTDKTLRISRKVRNQR